MSLNCSGNNLEELDVSHNTALTSLHCNGNNLTELNISNNIALTELYCEQNNLIKLDVSKNIELIKLYCSYSKSSGQLAELDLRNNVALEELDCCENSLTSLDLSRNTALISLNCRWNSLTSLDLSKNTALKSLDCSINAFNGLDVSNNKELTDLSCTHLGLRELNISNNKALTRLHCYENALKELNVSNNVALEDLDCSYNQLQEMDINKNVALTNLNCAFNNIKYINSSKNINLDRIECDNNHIEELVLPTSNQSKLTYLNCENNILTSLDVSQNTKLRTLRCNYNNLISLDLINNTDIRSLRCIGNNRLKSIDMRGNTCGQDNIRDICISSATTICCTEGSGIDNYCQANNIQYSYGDPSDIPDIIIPSIGEGSDIEINNVLFPDDVFRGYVSENFDTDKDGVLSGDEIDSVAEIYVENMGINSLEGIRYFTGLTELDCFLNGIAKLDLTGLNELEVLMCGYNRGINELDLSGLNKLKKLHCENLNISELDLSGLNNLEYLDCSYNNIAELDLHDCVNLVYLRCLDLGIVSLDLSEYESLKSLDCGGENLTELKVNEELQSLSITSSSGLESLDLHNCSKLDSLSIDNGENNNLKAIDLSGSSIKYIYAGNNTSLPILENIDLTGCTRLERLYLSAGKLEAIDLSACTWLKHLALYNAPLTSLDVRDKRYLTTLSLTKDALAEGFLLYCNKNSAAETYAIENGIPYKSHGIVTFVTNCDVELEPLEVAWGEKAVKPSGILGDGSMVLGWFTDEDCTQYFDFDTSIMEDITLYAKIGTDVIFISEENFPDAVFRNKLINGCLKDSSDNPITVYGDNVVGYYYESAVQTAPVRIDISYSWKDEIHSLKGIEKFEGLCYLSLGDYYNWNNQNIEELDLFNNVKLQELHCNGCSIKSLILPAGSELVKLDCGKNKLTSLDISNNPALISLNCDGNELEELDISNNTSLINVNCTANNLTELDVRNNVALAELYCGVNKLTNLDVSKNTALTKLCCGIDIKYSYGKNGNRNDITELDVSNNTLLTELSCAANNLTSLDISANTALTYLNCSGNKLESLDISNNSLLAKLYFGNNNLKELNVSNNTVLEDLDCSNNMLTELNVNNNAKLQHLYCENNQLASLGVSNNPELETLECYSNKLSELFINNNPQLSSLRCEVNQLTSLDVSDNPELECLYCYSNKLSELNVSDCIKLTELDCKDNQLVRLDLSKNINLGWLRCKSNAIEELILPESEELGHLNCGNNKLTNLDISNYIWLYELYCDRNQLTSLDVSKNTNLARLFCGSNQITSLDVSQHTILESLYCDYNPLTSLDFNENLGGLSCNGTGLTSLDLSRSNLHGLHCNDNNLISLDLSNSKYIYDIACIGNNHLKSIDMRGHEYSIDEVEDMKLKVPSATTICCTEGSGIAYYCQANNIKYTYGAPSDIPDIGTPTVSGNNPTVSGNNPTVSGNDPTVSGNNPSIIYGDMKDAEVTLSAACIKAKKNNAAQKPLPKKVTLNGNTLKNNRDYTISYIYKGADGKDVNERVDAVTKAGAYEIVLTAKEGGRYAGSQSVPLLVADINKTLMSTAKVTLEKKKYDYNGNEIKPAVKSVKVGKKALAEGTDYTVSYLDNISSGKGRVILTAVSGSAYAGTKEVTFDITGIKISKVKVTGITTPLVFNGKGNVTQDLSKIKLTYEGKDSSGKKVINELKEGTDYTVSYERNNSAGSAKIVFKGNGLYNGTLKKSFKISKVPLNRNMLAADAITAAHSKSGAKPDVTLTYNGTRLVNGLDYTISYKKNKAVSSLGNNPTLTIKGKGSYSGSINNIDFTIVEKDINDKAITVAVPDVAYNKKNNTYTTKLKVYDNGALLKANIDYTIEYADNTISTLPAGTGGGRAAVNVTIKGNDNYGGSRTEKFYVVEKLISGFSAKVSGTYMYDEAPITPDKSEIVIIDKKDNNHRLTSDEFEIVGYADNTHAGTGKVEVRGLGKYGGTKIIKFKIAKKK